MIDKEKVLHGLSSCGTDHGIPNICEVTECPYREDKAWCVHGLAHDAGMLIAELLNGQEPRVLTLGEVMALEEGTGDVWIEDAPIPGRVPCISATTMMDKSTLDSDGEVEFFDCSIYAITDYNANRANGWRCWTARPTEAQREAMAWKS